MDGQGNQARNHYCQGEAKFYGNKVTVETEKPEEVEKPEVRTRISETEFLIYLKDIEEDWGSKVKEAVHALQDIYEYRDSFMKFKQYGLQMRFFENEEGVCSFEASAKPPMGLRPQS